MLKKAVSLLLILSLLIIFPVGCNSKNAKQVTLTVASPNGVGALSLIKMFKEKPSFGENITFNYELINSPDLLSSKIISQEVDFIIVPTNLAAILHNKDVPYQLAASVCWGVLYLAGSEELSDWQDLKGEEIHLIGKGLNPDVILKFLLRNNNLEPGKDVKLTYLSGPEELASSTIAGKSKYALLPEPVLSKVLQKNDNIKILLDIQKEWSRVTGHESYPQTSLLIKKETIEKHKDVVTAFLKEYKKSIEWVNENPEKAGNYCEEFKVGFGREIAKMAVPRCNLKYLSAKDAKPSIEAYFAVLAENAPQSIGGKIPDETLYYTE